MNLSGNWKSKDDKYILKIAVEISGNFPIKLTMPVANGQIEGLLKNGQVANLTFEVNGKSVFVYLFVNQLNENAIMVRGTGRSTGRFKGEIPETIFYRQ